MNIDNEIKLDFKDVLIRPKRSTLGSRSEVSLERTFKFMNSGQSWTGIPIMTSNMDTTGTFEMYDVLSQYKMLTCFHKHYTYAEFEHRNSKSKLNREYYCLSTGIGDSDWEKLQQIVEYGWKDGDVLRNAVALGFKPTEYQLYSKTILQNDHIRWNKTEIAWARKNTDTTLKRLTEFSSIRALDFCDFLLDVQEPVYRTDRLMQEHNKLSSPGRKITSEDKFEEFLDKAGFKFFSIMGIIIVIIALTLYFYLK